MRSRTKIIVLLALVGLVGAGAYAYEAARPRVHPIKEADERKYGPLEASAPDPEDPRTELFGPARAVDGDTLLVQGTEADLWTIVAPKLGEICEKQGEPWACGDESRRHLDRLIAGRNVACRPEGPPTADGRWLGICYVADTPCQDDTGPCETTLGSLNLAQVRQGWARDSEGQFSEDEEDAQTEKLGLWAM